MTVDEFVADGGNSQYRLGLVLGRHRAQVDLSGEIDVSAEADLTRLLKSLDVLNVPVTVELAAVSFIDSYGIAPVVEASRRRLTKRLPPVYIGACSPPARRLLDVTGLGGHPHLDLARWDRLILSMDDQALAVGTRRDQR
jgi:anti-anti-sigma factor